MWDTVSLRELQEYILNGPHAAEYAPNVRLNDSPRESTWDEVPLFLPDGTPDLDDQGVQRVKRIEKRVNPYVYDNAIAIAINGKKLRKRYVSTVLSSLGLASKFPDGPGGLPGPLYAELVLQKIEAFADASVQSQDLPVRLFGSQIKRQLVHLGGQGMDFGNSDMHDMFDRMQVAGALDADDVAALKSVSSVDDNVSPEMVSRALRGPWGDE